MLARGATVIDAIASAKLFVFGAIDNATGWDVGSGHGLIDHTTSVTLVNGLESNAVYVLKGSTWARIH